MFALLRAFVLASGLIAYDTSLAQQPGSNAAIWNPTRPIRLIAPFAPGGPVDIGARLLAPKLQEVLGVQVHVENVPGGSGNIGTALVAKAPGDGTTLLVIS